LNRIFPFILVFLVLIASGCVRQAFVDSDDDPSDPFPVVLDEDFELGLGDTALLSGTGLEITFSVVTGDNRCPSDVVCVTAGQATILLLIHDRLAIRHNIKASIPGLTPTPFRDNDTDPIDGGRIKLLRLSPYPDTTNPHELGEYKALLVIES